MNAHTEQTAGQNEEKPMIINSHLLTPMQARYWSSLARRMQSRVQIIDPNRRPLKVLRALYGTGKTVYRASTGGKWGKSSQIVTL
jgi:hypothetical protein